MRLFILGLAALALALACSPPQSTRVQEKPPTFANFQAWAGKDAAGLGFTQEKLVAFLAARKANLNAARQPEWTTWLKTLEQTDNPSLKAWALARQVEAGDYTAYPTFESILARNLLGLSKPGRRDEDLVIHDPPQTPLPACLPGPRILNPRLRIFGLEMPGALRIDHRSVFWRSLRKTLQESPDRRLSAGLYSVWCYGTHPDQRDLILELAAHAQSPKTHANPEADPWNDPRFWIVTDWAMSWGTREDFQAIHAALKGAPQAVFDRLTRIMEAVPGFFTQPTPASARDGMPGLPAHSEPELPIGSKNQYLRIAFSQMKIRHMPPPPHYPAEALARRMMTTLLVTMFVDPEGRPTGCRPVPGPWLGFFAPTGVSYAMRWRFSPALRNGAPEYGRFTLTMPFQLRP